MTLDNKWRTKPKPYSTHSHRNAAIAKLLVAASKPPAPTSAPDIATYRAVHDIRSHRIPLYCYSSYHKLRWWWWLCCRIAKQSPRTAQTVSIMNRNNLQFVSIRKLTLQF